METDDIQKKVDQAFQHGRQNVCLDLRGFISRLGEGATLHEVEVEIERLLTESQSSHGYF